MTSIKADNLKLLEKKSPGCSVFLGRGSNDKSEVIKAKSGDFTLRYNGKLIHSTFDPVLEGKRFAGQSGISKGDQIFLYGFGFGYHIEGILEKIGATGRIQIMELNGEIFEAACSQRDMTKILSDHRVAILLGTNKAKLLKELDCALEILGENNGRMIFHLPSFLSIPAEFKDIEEALEQIRMEKRTGIKFVSIEKRNFEKNINAAIESKGVSELFGRYKDKLGIVVGAGPSLDMALPYLQLLSGKGKVLSTDTAFQILIDAGIVPDFVVSIDPQNHSLLHFKGYFHYNAILLFSPSSHPAIVKNYRRKKMVFTTPDEKKYFRYHAEPLASKGETSEGGSVSCVGLDLMIRFGFNPIVLFGQDCCFSLKRSYASHSAHCKEWQNSLGESIIDDFHKNSIRSQVLLRRNDRFGGKTAAHQNLYSYRNYIEQIAKANENIKFYNFHSMGLPIGKVEDIFSITEICTR